MAGLDALNLLTQEARERTPLADAKERWPEWYEKHVVNDEPRGGWTFGRAAYDRVLSVIKEQASVSHRYWCVFYLAVMANKCGVPYDELEDDAYGLLDRFDALSVEPGNRFTANDVASALEAYENGSASGKARRYTQAFCERKAAVKYGEKMGHGSNPPDKRLPMSLNLVKARTVQSLKHQVDGTDWRNKDGAPKKAMLVWRTAHENPGLNVTEIARKAGVSRPTVYKWLRPGWQVEYASAATDGHAADVPNEKPIDGRAEQKYAAPKDGLEQMVIRHIAAHPWEPFVQTAARFGLPGAAAVERIADANKDALDRAKLGIDGRLGSWDEETDDYYDAQNAATIAGRRDEFMRARESGVRAAIEWARFEVPDLLERLQVAREAGQVLTVDQLEKLRDEYVNSI
jgi:hypothetical protein